MANKTRMKSRIWTIALAFVIVCGLLTMTALAEDSLPQEETPNVTFEATGPNTGTLSGLEDGGSYTVTGAAYDCFIAFGTTYGLTDVSAGTLSIVKKGDGTTTSDSDAQTITITRPDAPIGVTAVGCTTDDNNDGKLLNVTEEMEYKLSTAPGWSDGTGSDITGLASGLYYVRVKASGTALASDTLSVMVLPYITGTPYGILVNMFPVTSGNAADVLGNGRVRYNPTENKLSITGGFDSGLYDLTIAGNGTVDVEINGGTGYAVNGKLTIIGADDVTVTSNTSGPSVINGEADITCSGNVTIQNNGTGHAVNGNLRINGPEGTGANNVTVSSTSGSPTIYGAAEITCTGDVNITNNGTGLVISSGGLTVHSADNVTVTAYTSGAPMINGNAAITCTGNVEIECKGNGFAVAGSLIVTGPDDNGAKDVTVRTKSGSSTITGNANLNCTGNVTIENVPTNILAVTGSAVSGDLRVTGPEDIWAKNVTVSSTSNSPTTGPVEITCTGDVNITNNGTGLVISSGGLTVHSADNVTVTAYTSGAPMINGNAAITCTGNVEIECKGNGFAVAGSLIVTGPDDNGAKDVTVRTKSKTPTITGSADITCTGNVLIKNAPPQNEEFSNLAVSGSLKVAGAKNVTVSATSESPTISGTADIDCTGDVTITNSGSNLAVGSSLIIHNADDVTVTATTDNAPVISGSADITCTGNVKIENTPPNNQEASGAALNGSLRVTGPNDTGAKNVTVRSKSVGPTIPGDADITCTGNVTIENSGTGSAVSGYLSGNLKVTGPEGTGAKNVTVLSESSNPTITGYADITSYGSVLIQNKGTGIAVYDTVTYTPGEGVVRYSVKTGDTEGSLTVVAEKQAPEAYGPESCDKKIIHIVVVQKAPPAPVVDVHFHIFGAAWKSDAGSHWRECIAGDGAISDKAAHADANGDGACDVCGYAMRVEKEMPFTDVQPSDWFYEDVQFVFDMGLMEGTSETDFAPGVATSRGMFVTMLYRLAGLPAAGGANGFADVAPDTWYTDAVYWAAQNGIVSGYSETAFGPDDNLTREQMVTILYNFAIYMGYDVSVGEDTNILSYDDAFEFSEYAFPAMQWACGAGILNGTSDSTLSPKGGATRVQVAAIIHRFCEIMK